MGLQAEFPDVLLKNRTGEALEALMIYKKVADEIDQLMKPQRLDFAVVWGSMALLLRVSGVLLIFSRHKRSKT